MSSFKRKSSPSLSPLFYFYQPRISCFVRKEWPSRRFVSRDDEHIPQSKLFSALRPSDVRRLIFTLESKRNCFIRKGRTQVKKWFFVTPYLFIRVCACTWQYKIVFVMALFALLLSSFFTCLQFLVYRGRREFFHRYCQGFRHRDKLLQDEVSFFFSPRLVIFFVCFPLYFFFSRSCPRAPLGASTRMM